MVALVSAETVLLVLLLVLVAGLLRSHAEILRRLGAPADGGAEAEDAVSGATGGSADSVRTIVGMPAPPAPRRPRGALAAPIAGQTPGGDAVSLDFRNAGGAPTLLAFLSSGCSSCNAFWGTLGDRRLAPAVQTVIVTRGPERESHARLRALDTAGVPVVMTSQAWKDYRVPGSPYFVLIDRVIRGEGTATGWPALASLVADAIGDWAGGPGDGGGAGPAEGAGERARSIDETFAAAGISPQHPSLYPGRQA